MILSFDIGGSRIKAGHSTGGVLTRLGDAPTPLTDFDSFAAVLGGFLAQVPGVRGVAIAIAGVVDPGDGRITVANIAGIHGRPLSRDLTACLGVPVLVLNDADCFALAEARQGAGRGAATVFGIILGTGVGGGLVIDGRLVTGAGGFAGEWGHGPVMQMPDLILPCGCGQVGCLDTVGAARGIERIHLIREGAALDAPALLAAWRAGDAAAARTVQTWAGLLGGQLAMLVNVLGVGAVPVGGGLSNAPDLVALLDRVVRAGILRRTDAPLVVPAMCGADAGLIGAAEAGQEAFGC